MSCLSALEVKVAKLMSGGLTIREISAELHLGESMVRIAFQSILEKLHVYTRGDAVGGDSQTPGFRTVKASTRSGP